MPSLRAIRHRLFDPDRIADRATPQEPPLLSEGIAQVWVNGRSVYARAATTDARPGRVTRREVDR